MRHFLHHSCLKRITLLSTLLFCSVTAAFGQIVVADGISYCIYNYNNDTIAYVSRNPGYSGVANIHSTVIYEYNHNQIAVPVKGIGVDAFAFCSGLTGCSIPNSITFISNSAFYKCSGLTNVTFTNITSIGDYAFYECSGLTNVTIPNITYIGDYAFYECSGMTSLTLSNTPNTKIGKYAFANCIGLTSITLPYSNTYGDYAFSGCTGLKRVVISDSGGLEGTGYFGRHVFAGCDNIETIEYHSPYAFCIGIVSDTSYHCNVKEVIFGQEVKHIYSGCCYGYDDLEEVTIPENVIYIGGGNYYNYYPNDYDDAFEGCNNLKYLNWNAIQCESRFSRTAQPEKVNIGNNVKVLPRFFIADSKISEIHIPNSVVKIGKCAFSGCTYLEDITIPNSVDSIEYSAFWKCTGLKKIFWNAKKCIIPLLNEAYYPSIFGLCDSLKHIFIGSEVQSIGDGVFSVIPWGDTTICLNQIDTVTCYSTIPPIITAECFDRYTYNNSVLEVPEGSLEAYRNAPGWKEWNRCVAIGTIPGSGDVNGDGKVSIDDVTTLIDYLLSGNITPFNVVNADVDEDGSITIADVTALIDLLLSGN